MEFGAFSISGELLSLEIYVRGTARRLTFATYASAPSGSSLKFIHRMNFGRSALNRLNFVGRTPSLIYYGSELKPASSAFGGS